MENSIEVMEIDRVDREKTERKKKEMILTKFNSSMDTHHDIGTLEISVR